MSRGEFRVGMDRGCENGVCGLHPGGIRCLFPSGRPSARTLLYEVHDRSLGAGWILELYLNVIEWGAGIYGAEEAARAWYGVPAARIDREQAARMAALLPSPLRRKPGRMNTYSAEILRRMAQTGW